jgi:hypothetical protein
VFLPYANKRGNSGVEEGCEPYHWTSPIIVLTTNEVIMSIILHTQEHTLILHQPLKKDQSSSQLISTYKDLIAKLKVSVHDNKEHNLPKSSI